MGTNEDSWKVSRRRVLQGIGGTVTSAAIGCTGDAQQPGERSDGPITGEDELPDGSGGSGGAPEPPDGTEPPPGLSPEELLAPIDTIVVLMLENRSFDHHLGASYRLHEGRNDVVGPNGSEANPSPDGDSVQLFHMLNTSPKSPPHQWDSAHLQWSQGANDGFVVAHAGSSQHEAMGYFIREQVPVTHALADAYALCNHWYCSLLGGTWANRFHLHGATSKGQKHNLPIAGFEPIWEPAKDAGLTVKNYNHGIPWATGGYGKVDDLATFASFKQDAADGQLPNFSIIDPLFFGIGANDDHPHNYDIGLAQLLIHDVYDTLANSPQWDGCLLVVVYDEHGGFYDHVAPPTTIDLDYPEFAQLGFRVPAIVAGPYVRRGEAVDTVFDHVSVLATVARRWGLSPLNERQANTADLSSCIDPTLVEARSPQEPYQLPPIKLSMDKFRQLRSTDDNQHPELADALEQMGLFRSLLRKHSPDVVFKRHLDDCVRRGIARLS